MRQKCTHCAFKERFFVIFRLSSQVIHESRIWYQDHYLSWRSGGALCIFMTSPTTLQQAVIDLHTQASITGPSFHTNAVHLSRIKCTHGLLNTKNRSQGQHENKIDFKNWTLSYRAWFSSVSYNKEYYSWLFLQVFIAYVLLYINFDLCVIIMMHVFCFL